MARRKDYDAAFNRLFDEKRGPHGRCEERATEIAHELAAKVLPGPAPLIPAEEARALTNAYAELCNDDARALIGWVLYALLHAGLLDWPEALR